MKQAYISPSLRIVHVQPAQCIVESPASQSGPTADFMSNPGISAVKSTQSRNHSVWDDDWSQEP